ncbi:hypothetical protein BGZ63DRAFT_358129 [Mariannaea sp. PMI_226]|nr:hypothetical protein BGZ63DRAFT_358129 [Mariannaea sp. PMI_226]
MRCLTNLSRCELCRVRKVKCDRGKPTCSWCMRNHRQCVYRERRKPGGDSQPNPEFAARLGYLDALVNDVRQRVDDHIKHHGQGNEHSPPMLRDVTHSESPNSTSLPLKLPGLESPQLTNDRDTTTPDPNHFLGWSHNVDWLRRPVTSTTSHQEITLTSDPDLPPHDMLYAIVDLFFKHINTWCPILDRKATFATYFGSTSITEGERVVLHAIIATTLRFFSDPRLKPPERERFHAISSKIVKLYSIDETNLSSLKALTILYIDVLGTTSGSNWNFLALITRNVLQLDLHVERKAFLSTQDTLLKSSRNTILPEPTSWFEDEGRRRLCWVVYALDRYATLATSSKFMMIEEDMKRCLPCRYDLWLSGIPVETRASSLGTTDDLTSNSNTENLGSFSYHCEVLRILSRVDNFLKTPVDIFSEDEVQTWQNSFTSLDQELWSWLHNLPGDHGKMSLLCHSDPGARVVNWIMLHAAFVTSLIRLNSAAAYPIATSPIFTSSFRAMQTCLSAVDSLQSIAQNVLETDSLSLLGPHFAFSLWVSARLLLVHAAAVGGEVESKIDFYIATLREMGRYWNVASGYSATLSRLIEQGRHGDNTFAKMRCCAYELAATVSLARSSSLEDTWTQETSLIELDYVDVFGFFNYPRLPS